MKVRRVLGFVVLLCIVGEAVVAQRGRVTARTQVDAVKEAYVDVVAKANPSVVDVLSAGSLVALGTVVGDGLIVTKASLLGLAEAPPSGGSESDRPDGEDATIEQPALAVDQGDRSWPAVVVARSMQHDLALLAAQQGEAAFDLPAIVWADGEPHPGALLACPNGHRLPVAIGILSSRAYRHGRAFLGVRFAREALRIQSLVPDGPSLRAGLQIDDVILAIGERAVDDIVQVREVLAEVLPGAKVSLRIRRAGGEVEMPIELGANQDAPVGGQEPLWGDLSAVRSGFTRVLQHDGILDPADCGGPVVDLEGACVGINIARAGRVETLSAPAREVRAFLAAHRDGG